jgi:RNA polymerase sigma-70 factor (ECF subfamily)
MRRSAEVTLPASPGAEAPAGEAQLVLLARGGDSAAWESIVRLHQEPVFRLAYLLLGDAQEAEDAAQEAFIRAYRALGSFDTQRPLRPWLLSIGANLARNRLRSIGRYLSALRRKAQSEPAYLPSAEQHSDQRQQAQQVWQAVRRLPPADQQVIYLRIFLELPVEEAGQVINVAPGTVKSRLHRALQRLKEIVDQDFPGLKDVLE